jgi:hypothetical protein
MYLAELISGDTSNSAYPIYYPTDIGKNALVSFSDHFRRPGQAS